MITAMPRIAIAVGDFDAAVTAFRDKFGLPVIDISGDSVDSLGAKVAMCVPRGGSKIELMSPADPEAPLSQSLSRFLKRRGEGLFALMLEAPEPDDEAELLIERGLNVLPLMPGAAGRDIHPDSTHGVLIRVYPENSFQGEMSESEHSLSLSGVARAVIVVDDADEAADTYGSRLRLPVEAPVDDEYRGVESVVCRPPAGGIIELVSVLDTGRPFAAEANNFMNARGQGLFALVLQSPAPAETGKALRARGLTVSPGTDTDLAVDTRDTFGARIWIERAGTTA